MFYNIPESLESTPEHRIKHDEGEVHNILKIVSPLITNQTDINTITNFRVYRVGRPIPQKSRPLKVTFSSPSVAINLLSKNKFITLPNSVSMSSDRTQAQREYMQCLRSELEERLKTEDNLIIKYINNTPKIVKDLKNVHQPIA